MVWQNVARPQVGEGQGDEIRSVVWRYACPAAAQDMYADRWVDTCVRSCCPHVDVEVSLFLVCSLEPWDMLLLLRVRARHSFR